MNRNERRRRVFVTAMGAVGLVGVSAIGRAVATPEEHRVVFELTSDE